MTGIIRFPRGSRPNKVTKPPAPPTRRAANGSNGSTSGAPVASTSRQLAIEQALSEQQQQEQQQQQYEAATATDTTDNLSPEQAQSLIQDGSFYNADGQVHDGETTDYGVKDEVDGELTHGGDHDQDGGKPDGAAVDSNMLDLHGGGEGSGSHNDHAENMVADINEAEMSEMVGDAVNSYTEENGVGVPPRPAATAQPTASNGHGIDMDLSAAAAAAAAAAAVASASHLATSGQGHAINHHLHTEAPGYSSSTHAPEDQMSRTQHAQPSTADNAALAAPPTPVDPTAAATTPQEDPAAAAPASTADMARDSGYNHLVVESALAKRLSREPGLRPAQQRRPDQQLNLGRRSNVEALFAHIAGDEVAVPCKNCHKGHGPWTACVVVDGQMCGSCANCWFNASGARCSFHETKTTPMQSHIHGHPLRQSLGGGVSASPSTSVPSTLDPQLAAATAAGPYTIGSPLGGSSSGGIAAHAVHNHFSVQQQQQQNALSSSSAAPPSSSSAAQQAAAAAAAAAVAVQQLSNGGHFPGVAAATDRTGGSSNGVVSNGSAAFPSASSPLNLDLVAALLSANRSNVAASATAAADPTPLVGLVINQALAEVRNTDQRGRDLMLVEIAAKQLALAIVRYGEGTAATTAPTGGVSPAGGAGGAAPDSQSAPAGKDASIASGSKDGTAPGAAD